LRHESFTGYLLLEGGAEFSGQMSAPDLRAIELAGGFDAPICIIPAAAAPDNNHKRAGGNGVRWFKNLGAKNVVSLDVIDSKSANNPALAASIRTSRLIYLLGGFPRHLAKTLAGSACWRATLDVYEEGGVIAGSSAGAMVLCEHYYDPYEEKRVLRGLNLIPNACVLPHHNNFGRSWAAQLAELLPDSVLIGIDESTGVIRSGGEWEAQGAGGVTLYRAGAVVRYGRGERFSIPQIGL
jgi:cyanophycinase